MVKWQYIASTADIFVTIQSLLAYTGTAFIGSRVRQGLYTMLGKPAIQL